MLKPMGQGSELDSPNYRTSCLTKSNSNTMATKKKVAAKKAPIKAKKGKK